MTVLAWDGYRLAADGMMTYGDAIGSLRQQKIFRPGDYQLDTEWTLLGQSIYAFGITGAIGSELPLIDVLNNELTPYSTFPKHLSFSALLISRHADVYVLHKNEGFEGISLYPVDVPFIALGCGSDAASAAMISGHKAVDAVRIAMDVNVYCGGSVQVWEPFIEVSELGVKKLTQDNSQTLWIEEEN